MSDNWREKAAAIVLAPGLYHAWVTALNETHRPAFEDMAYAERDLWVLLSETVLASVCELVTAFPSHQPDIVEDSLFQATAEMTRKHFAVMKGGKT